MLGSLFRGFKLLRPPFLQLLELLTKIWFFILELLILTHFLHSYDQYLGDRFVVFVSTLLRSLLRLDRLLIRLLRLCLGAALVVTLSFVRLLLFVFLAH